MQNVVAICLGFCGIVLFTHLLRSGSLGAPSYSALVMATLVGSIAIAKLDLLQVLDLKNLSVTLRQIEDAKKEIYAKSEAVTKLGEKIGELAAWNVRTVNRFTDENHTKEMVRQREQIATMLRDVGATPERVEQIVNPINDTVLNDLKQEVLQALVGEVNRLNQSGGKVNWTPLEPKFRELLKNFDRAGIVAEAKSAGLYSQTVEEALNKVDRFSKTHQL
jgi:hypothetical protein